MAISLKKKRMLLSIQPLKQSSGTILISLHCLFDNLLYLVVIYNSSL